MFRTLYNSSVIRTGTEERCFDSAYFAEQDSIETATDATIRVQELRNGKWRTIYAVAVKDSQLHTACI